MVYRGKTHNPSGLLTAGFKQIVAQCPVAQNVLCIFLYCIFTHPLVYNSLVLQFTVNLRHIWTKICTVFHLYNQLRLYYRMRPSWID